MARSSPVAPLNATAEQPLVRGVVENPTHEMLDGERRRYLASWLTSLTAPVSALVVMAA
jgi:hypothetical protein